MSMSHTIQTSYEAVRSGYVAADDTALDGATSGRTYMQADRRVAECWEAGPEVGGVTLIFAGSSADTETFSWKLYGYRVEGPAEFVCEGTGALGPAVAPGGKLYADTLVITDPGNWLDIPVAVDSTNNRICKVCFDLCGFKHLYVEFSDFGGVGEATDIQAFVAFF